MCVLQARHKNGLSIFRYDCIRPAKASDDGDVIVIRDRRQYKV